MYLEIDKNIRTNYAAYYCSLCEELCIYILGTVTTLIILKLANYYI